MRGAPWDGLYYGFVLLVIVFTGALAMAIGSQDFLTRSAALAVLALCAVGMFRLVRRAVRTSPPDRPTGRWWFGG